MSETYGNSSTLEPRAATASSCPVCRGSNISAWKKGDLARSLQPEDLHITDSRYGITLELFRCGDCGFIHAHGEDVEHLGSLYERMEDPHYDDTSVGRALQMEWIVKLIRRHIPNARTLLDIGAGTGRLVSAAQCDGLDAAGVEPSKALKPSANAANYPCTMACILIPLSRAGVLMSCVSST